ncbi:DUF3310 domain-containing protein [Nocardia otitidiscaviarum]|uniref:DUF3310 domain-containing protein n=1 Tax=Nocardia otitidiscaviarum TaxID=1823 RepID=UPI002454EC8E|nr:DUF3310 domain-containing protein [Nocardia otitidiscaviarum]
MSDVIHHPAHYTQSRFACECIDITRHLTFNAGNAFKYVWRHQEKNGVEDLRKAAVYLRWTIDDERELARAAALPGSYGFVQDLVHEYVTPFAVGPYEALIDIVNSNFVEALIRVESAIRAYEDAA